MKANGLSIVHVPYKGGAGPAVAGLLGGDTQVMFVTLSSALAFVLRTTLRFVAPATSAKARSTIWHARAADRSGPKGSWLPSHCE